MVGVVPTVELWLASRKFTKKRDRMIVENLEAEVSRASNEVFKSVNERQSEVLEPLE